MVNIFSDETEFDIKQTRYPTAGWLSAKTALLFSILFFTSIASAHESGLSLLPAAAREVPLLPNCVMVKALKALPIPTMPICLSDSIYLVPAAHWKSLIVPMRFQPLTSRLIPTVRIRFFMYPIESTLNMKRSLMFASLQPKMV